MRRFEVDSREVVVCAELSADARPEFSFSGRASGEYRIFAQMRAEGRRFCHELLRFAMSRGSPACSTRVAASHSGVFLI